VKENNNHTWFLKASKEKAREFEQETLIRKITESISTRKHRDLLDILAEIEQTNGWPIAIEYLSKANGETYNYNMGSEGPGVQLEPLKYREVIFKLFHCEGLEPVAIDTSTILEELSHEKSMVDAAHRFACKVEELVWKQIDKNDLLFFTPPNGNMWISDDLKNRILNFHKKKINEAVIWKMENKINIESLWHSELGRQALSSIGIQGLHVSPDELSEVLSVIQVSPKPQPKILNFDEREVGQYRITTPSHRDYKLLLTSIIEHNSSRLSHLGSKHSIPTLNCMLYDALNHYEISTSSSNYQNVLTLIVHQVMIRELCSISIFEQLSHLEDKRIATIAIIALGNYFHESAASVLVNLVCNKKNDEVIRKALTALENLCTNNPEAVLVVENALKMHCTNYGKLIHLFKRISR
jgi:hypothetical protein